MRGGDILELNTFVAVAEVGRFATAAVRLGVTPSGVSQSIRRLEARLGLRLFNRTTRSLALTEAGEALLADVKPALDRLATAEADLAGRTGMGVHRIRLSISSVAMEIHLAPVLAEFDRQHPRVMLEVAVEDRLVDPVAARFDAVIRRGELLEKDMIARRISDDDRLVLVAAPRYLANAPKLEHPRDLVLCNRITIRRPRTGARTPWRLARGEDAVNIRPSDALTVDGASVARDCAIHGLGIAYLARDYVQPQLRSGALTPVLAEWGWPLAGFHLMYAVRGGPGSPLQWLERRMRQAREAPDEQPSRRQAADPGLAGRTPMTG